MLPSPDDRRRSGAPHSQTLDRGVQLLELVADAGRPTSMAELAGHLGVHRSVVYRMVRTLEDHRLLSRDHDGLLTPGVGLSTLARSVKSDLQTAAVPELSDVANDLAMTAFLVVRDGHQCVTIASVEPRHSPVHVIYRPGTRHEVDRGAPGLALLAGEPPVHGERTEVAQARERGWVTSHGEVLTGMRSVASPIVGRRGDLLGAVALVYVDTTYSLDDLGRRTARAARAIRDELP